MTIATVPIQENAQARIYSFSNAIYLGDTRYAGTDRPTIITPAPQWAYAIHVPLMIPSQASAQIYSVKLSILVHRGAIGVGILNKDRTLFCQEILLGQQGGWREIELTTPPIGEAGPLIFRNAFADGRSSAQCMLVQTTPAAQASLPTNLASLTTLLQPPHGLNAERRTIIFLHIPKTGGTTVWSTLGAALRSTFNVQTPEGLRKLLDFPDYEIRGCELIHGHMPYGLHLLLPQKSKYVVFLRDPVDRVISGYYYIKRQPKHGLYRESHAGMSLAEYALSREMDNMQTRYLGLYEILEMLELSSSWWRSSRQVQQEHLERAKKRLASCDFIEFREDLDRDLCELFQKLGLSPPGLIPKSNETIDRPALSDIDSKTVEKIRQRNLFDVELYQYARTLRNS